MHYLAQSVNTSPGIIRGFGLYGLVGTTPSSSPGIFNTFLSNIIGLLTVVGGIWFFFVLMSGAIMWIGAGGDKAKLIEARQRIFMGLIGITLIVAAVFIADIVGGILGFDIMDPGGMIPEIDPEP